MPELEIESCLPVSMLPERFSCHFLSSASRPSFAAALISVEVYVVVVVGQHPEVVVVDEQQLLDVLLLEQQKDAVDVMVTCRISWVYEI